MNINAYTHFAVNKNLNAVDFVIWSDKLDNKRIAE